MTTTPPAPPSKTTTATTTTTTTRKPTAGNRRNIPGGNRRIRSPRSYPTHPRRTPPPHYCSPVHHRGVRDPSTDARLGTPPPKSNRPTRGSPVASGRWTTIRRRTRATRAGPGRECAALFRPTAIERRRRGRRGRRRRRRRRGRVRSSRSPQSSSRRCRRRRRPGDPPRPDRSPSLSGSIPPTRRW